MTVPSSWQGEGFNQVPESENRIHSDEVAPIKSVGLTWAQVQLQVIETGARLGISLNPLALIRGKEIRTCPDFNETIKTGDKLSILAHHGFDWEKFEVEMSSKT